MNPPIKKLALLSLVVVLVIGCRVFFPFVAAYSIVALFGYWILLVGSGLYAYQLWCAVKDRRPSAFLRANWVGLLVALLGTFFIETHEPRQFKVLFDEFVISGVARNMHFKREATYATKAHNVRDELDATESIIDKRPLFFPFMLACVHDLTGYRPGNVFVLNAVAVFLLLFLTYRFGVQYGGWQLGLACAGLWLGVPLLAQAATSGGFDVFNLMMLMVFLYFGRAYLHTGSAASQSMFVLTTVLLAQVRYESILFVVPMALVILVRWYREGAIKLGWVVVFAPVFLLLPLMSNLVQSSTTLFAQTDPGQSYFSFIYLQENMERAIWYLFNIDFRTTNSVIMSIIGVVSVVAFLVRIGKGWRRLLTQGDDILLLVFGLFILANTTLILCNFWGQLDDPVASRFSLPLQLFFVCCFAWVVNQWRGDRSVPVWLLSVVGFAFVMAIPSAAQHYPTRAMIEGREQTWLLEEIAAPGHRGALIVANPLGPILYNHPAIGLDVAEANKWKINECLKQHLYPELLVLERWAVDYKTGAEIPYGEDRSLDFKVGMAIGSKKTALSAAFKKELVAEIRLRPNVVARLSRIISVSEKDAVPPESYSKEVPPFENARAYQKHIYSALP